MLNPAELRAAIIQRAGDDQAFRTALLTHPQETILELAGGTLPEGFEFNPITELELTDEDLSMLTLGGAGPTAACSLCRC
jgi:hypothetical protein